MIPYLITLAAGVAGGAYGMHYAIVKGWIR